MEPREIDRQMAEKVMGWHLKFIPCMYSTVVGRSAWFYDGRLVYEKVGTEAWHPSTNIAQALGDGKSLDTVVGKMRGEGYDFSLMVESGYDWSCDFWKGNECFTGRDDTPAMAINLAALKAVEEAQ